ncbi:MAG: N-acetylmuramoyl-L-alanine amidase, partial [SAR324 cluster bacterium]|nr:N-acetylmuramoyl-L-alanine amidase [SAR324 cluster bacterium]
MLLLLLVPIIFPHKIHAARSKKSTLQEFTFGTRQKFRAGFDGRTIIVQFQPRPGDGMYAFARWILRDWKNRFKDIKKYNRNRPLLVNRYIQIPFKALNDEIQSMVLQAVFSNDSREEDGWAHRVLFTGETVSLIAGVFARDDIPPEKLIGHNDLNHQGKRLKKGDTIMIPWKWVKESLRLRPVSVREPLIMENKDYDSGHAYYLLQKGESVYSAVIVRFTGRTLAEDVNRMAEQLLKLNRIRNEHFIPVGTKLKIPIEWISEEYLIQQQSLAKVTTEVEEPDRKPVVRKDQPFHIILDPGHGGIDPGAIIGSKRKGYKIFEDETVYDISLRVADLLKNGNYVVHSTLVDPNQTKPVERLATKKDEDEYITVSPAYKLRNADTGINMRIFLVNSIYKKLIRKRVPKENILLVSLHGDALHSSLRGVTIYYPDHRLRADSFKLSQSVYRRRREFQRELKFKDRDNIKSARVSADFGKKVVEEFK